MVIGDITVCLELAISLYTNKSSFRLPYSQAQLPPLLTGLSAAVKNDQERGLRWSASIRTAPNKSSAAALTSSLQMSLV